MPFARKSNSSKKRSASKKRFSRAPASGRTKITSNIKKLNAIASLTETKLVGLNSGYEVPFVPIQALAQGYMKNFVLNQVPTAWSGSSWTSLAGMPNTQGVGGSQRIGDYAFLQKTTFNTILDYAPNAKAVPHEYRVIMYKPKRRFDPAGVTNDPVRTLFLNSVGVPIGTATSGITLPDLYMCPTNKKNFTVFSDKKFILQAPVQVPAATGTGVQASYVAPSGIHPSTKNLSFTFNHYRKTFWDGTNTIRDYDPSFCVTLLCRAVGQDTTADGQEISYKGTTSYMDN